MSSSSKRVKADTTSEVAKTAAGHGESKAKKPRRKAPPSSVVTAPATPTKAKSGKTITSASNETTTTSASNKSTTSASNKTTTTAAVAAAVAEITATSATAATNATTAATTAVTSATPNAEEIDPWPHMFYKLMVFRAVQGDFNVPAKAAEHKKLCEWIKEQRRQYKLCQDMDPTAKLTKEQIQVLESVQFPLTTRGDDHWKRNFENLKKFKEEHGHCLVPRLSEIQGLGDWVTDQRRQLKSLRQGKPSLLTPDRKNLLDELGFVWEVRNRPEWADRFQQLLEYKKKYGTTCVPQFYADDRGLGKWVAKQREQYKLKRQGKHSFLTADREEQLVGVGFVWSVKGNAADEDDDDEGGLLDYPTATADPMGGHHDDNAANHPNTRSSTNSHALNDSLHKESSAELPSTENKLPVSEGKTGSLESDTVHTRNNTM